MRVFSVVAVAATLLLGCGTVQEKQDERPIWARGSVIEAQGRAYVEMAPNRAAFTVNFEHKAEQSEAASSAVVKQANTATEAIRLASDNQVRITSNLSVRPYYSQVKRRYGEHDERLVENIHPDALLGYVATVSVNVTVLDPERAAKARGAALAAGPVNSTQMRFFLEPTTENQRAAYAQAVNDAAERAKLIAEASGSVLGALLVLQEGAGPCLGAPSTETGYASRTQFDMAPAFSAGAPAPESRARNLAEAAEPFALAADLQPQHVEARVCAVYSVR
ncbi:SIMPL domain-containing protein [Marinimicrobium sp. ABcell2]|uniref:SIMPL domain-containing protein n=1 Tax=Marinimicrobium sp. ABcell2 TaxID=3069751 RepID=UPI0027B06210|nr:SIMPL domain-containing protein [Marinimicrobium sp. ABcell2]MDQ2077867.1 SIMPL domain-containing protein [Marinimicrobium sp. ABcell2]